jgi:hypothetical protein
MLSAAWIASAWSTGALLGRKTSPSPVDNQAQYIRAATHPILHTYVRRLVAQQWVVPVHPLQHRCHQQALLCHRHPNLHGPAGTTPAPTQLTQHTAESSTWQPLAPC